MAKSMLLQTNDSAVFIVELQVAAVSDLLKEMIGLFGVDKNEEEIIRLDTMNSQVFAKALEWMIRHQDKPHIEKPPKRRRNSQFSNASITIPQWDLQFFEKIPSDELMALAEAADFLRIEYLQVLISKYFSNFARHRIVAKKISIKKANTLVDVISGDNFTPSSNDFQQSSRDNDCNNCNDDQTNIPKDRESVIVRQTIFPLACRHCKICRSNSK